MIIRTDADRNRFITKILALPLSPDKPREFTADLYKENRSAAQRRLQFMWYAQIGKATGYGKENTANFCKWSYGCSILAEADTDFSAMYGGLIEKYEYEQCVSMMEYIPVTSLMSVAQNSDYLKEIERYAIGEGIQVTKPIDVYTLAMGEQYEQTHSSD